MAPPQLQPSMPFIVLAFLSLLGTFASGHFINFNKLELPPGAFGPGSATFGGLIMNDLFTTVEDGRILKWEVSAASFVDFAYTSPTRTKPLCDGTTNPDMWPICGRPMGLSYHPVTGLLYIIDAYFGLLVVGPHGGLATQLAGGFKFPVGIDIDLLTGNIYIGDTSLTYTIGDTTKPGYKPDSTGRLLRYNPVTKEVSVLLSGLAGSGGPAMSADSTFVLVPEISGKRILKYWLVGTKINTAELLLNTPGNPNKIKRAERWGAFWVAISIKEVSPTTLTTPEGLQIYSDGLVLQTVPFFTEYVNRSVSLVTELGGKLYVGSRLTNFIGVYSN